MEDYTRVIGATSNNIRVPSVGEINQGNNPLTPFESSKNNGYIFEVSSQVSKISTELTNLIIAKGITPNDATLTQVLESIDIVAGVSKWVTGEEYSIGAITRLTTGTNLYRSEINNNIGLDIAAIAYNAGTTYEIDEVAADTNGDIYRSLTGGNIGNPLTDPVNWELAWIFLGDLSELANSSPAGLVSPYANDTPPAGWLECDGSTISRTTYSRLFAAISTVWGVGDGSTTFNIPDLRGEFVRGWDNGKGTDSGRAFASSQAAQIEQHKHETNNPVDGNTGTWEVATNAPWGEGSTVIDILSRTEVTSASTETGGAYTNPEVVLNAVDETRPINIALMYCIKY